MMLKGFADGRFRKKRSLRKPHLACIIVSLIATAPSEARPAAVCMPSEKMEAALIDWYQEQPIEEASKDIVLWASQGGETWTLVKYRSDGVACAMESGADWRGFESLASFDQYLSEDQ